MAAWLVFAASDARAQSSGACCVPAFGDCFDVATEADCTAKGGLYQGDGTLCSQLDAECPIDDCNNNGIPDGLDLEGTPERLFGSPGGDCGEGVIYLIDRSTGVSTIFLDLTPLNSDYDLCSLSGLALSQDGAKLYVTLRSDSAILIIDLGTNEVTPLDLEFQVFTRGQPAFQDIAVLGDGSVVATDASAKQLWDIDINTGNASLRCSTGEVGFSGLTTNSAGELFGTTGRGVQGGQPGTLYSIDADVDPNGVCEIVQFPEGTDFPGVPGITFDDEDTLYGASVPIEDEPEPTTAAGISQPRLIVINSNGAGFEIAPITGPDLDHIDGLQYVPFGEPRSQDCNENGVPDECEPDCDNDGIPDDCEADADGDGVPDDCDDCPNDPLKVEPGLCGCGVADTDTDDDGVPDCMDNCLNNPNPDQSDSDGDGIGDACDDGEPQSQPSSQPAGQGTPDCGVGLCGFGTLGMMPFMFFGLALMRGRKTAHRRRR